MFVEFLTSRGARIAVLTKDIVAIREKIPAGQDPDGVTSYALLRVDGLEDVRLLTEYDAALSIWKAGLAAASGDPCVQGGDPGCDPGPLQVG